MRNKRSEEKREQEERKLAEEEHRKTQFSSQIKAICWLVENCLSTKKNHRKIEEREGGRERVRQKKKSEK